MLMLPVAEFLVWLEFPNGMSFIAFLGILEDPFGMAPRSRRAVPDPERDAAIVAYDAVYESPDNPKKRNPGDGMAVASF